jgi:hypothetical protein
MRNKIIFFGIVVVATLAAAALFYRFIVNTPSDQVNLGDFNQIGNLVKDNPGFQPDSWYLVYELPGQPGLSKRLEFDSASACAVNAPAAPCDLSKLEQGARVRVEGRSIGEEVLLVRTIQSPEVIPSDIAVVPSPTTTPATSTGTTSRPATTTGTTTVPGTSTGTGTATSTGTTTTGLTVRVYYYNPTLDQGPGGAQCTSKGLVSLTRVIPRTNSPLQDTIKLLLRGELTETEREQGITSEFPLSQVTLLSASNNKGVLTLTFRDPKNRTSGGSCRVNIMWKQIEATARQFPGVETVRFSPETLFQP